MGATQSYTGSIEEPFPIPPGLNSDLDKLSAMVARILSTSDIYDINNLSKPGVCGDYAVFLKARIEKTLQPFKAKISLTEGAEQSTELAYVNTRDSLGTTKSAQKARDAFCS